MIGHKVRAARALQAAAMAAGKPRRRQRTPKRLLYEAPPQPAVATCGKCGALRQANAEGKLPPHRCAA